MWDELVASNPWWQTIEKINNDKNIEEFNKSNIKWYPRIRNTINYNKDLVYSLRGPRQVGKTTLIKLQIKQFLEQNIPKWNIMYYAFDVYNNPKDLVNFVRTYFNETKRVRDTKNRNYLFLDEISTVKNWEKGIKKLYDDGYLKNCTVIVTGSHSIDLQRSSELLPGRLGEIDQDDTHDKIFLPMKFSEYVSLLDDEIKKIIDNSFKRENRKEIFQKLLNNEIDSRFELIAYLPKLNQFLNDYLLTGGIPKVIDEYIKNKKIKSYVYDTYFRSIIGDLHQLEANEGIFKRLIGYIIEHRNYPMSLRDIQKNIDVGSHNTVDRYINLLCNMFILTNFYKYDSRKKQKRSEKPKKFHFHDPFFFHILNSWIKPEESFKISKESLKKEFIKNLLLEGVIGDHLIRFAFFLSNKKYMFDYTDHVFYWQDKNENEVDYILNDKYDIEVPIEVKYTQNSISKDRLTGFFNFKKINNSKNGIVITKNDLNVDKDYVKIPASIFLLLI